MKRLFLAILVVLGLGMGASANSEQCLSGQVWSPDRGLYLCVTIASMGGYKTATIFKHDKAIFEVKDVTAFFWVSNTAIIYSVSPIYGLPGIFIFDTGTQKISRVVCPKVFGQGYPNGADYFVLSSHNESDGTITFWHSPNVELMNKLLPESRTVRIRDSDPSCLSPKFRPSIR